ncbi:ribosome maturation factor RimM [Methylobacterium sp. E-016]|jgi:16S rRNA processing protein RimM|uniref:ribosome maturation factor RimM n=1 Tax=unclassified Methylobacterium TaxID=2615210 RepID=UPI001FBBF936|nr:MULTISPECIES: ribosome maturation factor RimM [unclassified Methylobacterium]MCJ2009421.1 ribosome maturation factor RimM [Methylobacterium sp. J-092]MCJ2074399.1 ribosome maturation factor RimM [Methylobacterium sp. E-016]
MRRPAGPSRGDGARRGAIAPGTQTSPRPKPAAKPAPAAVDPSLVVMGEFGRAQGLNGEIRLKSYTGDPQAIAGYGSLVAADGRTFELTSVRPAPGSSPDLLIARVRGVSDRTGAEALNRTLLHVPRERLGDPDEDEVFTADLVGLPAIDAAGTVLGTIVAVPNYGGGDLLEIKPAQGGATALLPFTKAFVPELDVAAGRVVVAPPEDFFAPPGPKPADDPG